VQLARLIDLTGQIDDLVDVQGAEEDLRDMAEQMPIPSGYPRFAEEVVAFKDALGVPHLPGGSTTQFQAPRRSNAVMQEQAARSAAIREQAAQFLAAANANCLIAVATRFEQVKR
jgi:hypothetical protein